jgi:hypothetical protein
MAYSEPERMHVGPPATEELKTMQPRAAASAGWHNVASANDDGRLGYYVVGTALVLKLAQRTTVTYLLRAPCRQVRTVLYCVPYSCC